MKGKCLNPIVLAWAAGFVDGEGCIRIAKRKNPSNPVYSLEITISQNCIETLEHFKEVLGIDCGRSRIHSATARVKSDVYYLTYVCVRRTHVDAQSTRRIQLLAGTQRCGSNSLI